MTGVPLLACAEPSADAPAVAARPQHGVLASRREKANQPAGNGLDILESPLRCEYPQRAARARLPLHVQVQRQRYPALRTAMRLIQMARIFRTRRIPAIVQLRLKQSQERLAVQLQTQLLQFFEQYPLRAVKRLAEPTAKVAANIRATLQVRAVSHAGCGKFAARLASVRALKQRTDLCLCDEPVSNRDSDRTEAGTRA